MKLKDILALVFLAVVLLVVGTLVIGQLGSGAKERQAEIEVVTPIDPSFNTDARETVLGKQPEVPIESYTVPIDLQQGLGNASPFRAE